MRTTRPSSTGPTSTSGRRSSSRPACATSTPSSATWRRSGRAVGARCPRPWYRLPVFYFSNVSEIRGPGDPVWAPRGSVELDFELEVCALVDTPARDLPAERAEEAIGGYTIFNDWSARDLQRDETTVRLGPAKGKDFAITIGPWLVTPDELADARRPGTSAPDLGMTVEVRTAGGPPVAVTNGRWADSPLLVRPDARAGVRRRAAPAGRPVRLGHRRWRLPARGARRDAGSVSPAG